MCPNSSVMQSYRSPNLAHPLKKKTKNHKELIVQRLQSKEMQRSHPPKRRKRWSLKLTIVCITADSSLRHLKLIRHIKLIPSAQSNHHINCSWQHSRCPSPCLLISPPRVSKAPRVRLETNVNKLYRLYKPRRSAWIYWQDWSKLNQIINSTLSRLYNCLD